LSFRSVAEESAFSFAVACFPIALAQQQTPLARRAPKHTQIVQGGESRPAAVNQQPATNNRI
jgi:hypothetical protein